MKKFNLFHIIWDPKNKFFWEENFHYGFGPNNREVFEARFTDNLMEATRMTKKHAKEVLKRFVEYDCIVGGRIKADVAELEIKEVGVTVELQIRPRWFP
jgi:hypothetical protein